MQLLPESKLNDYLTLGCLTDQILARFFQISDYLHVSLRQETIKLIFGVKLRSEFLPIGLIVLSQQPGRK
jgi:hypothetical protein